MNGAPLFTMALVLLPAVGLVTWAWFVMTQVEEDLRRFVGEVESAPGPRPG